MDSPEGPTPSDGTWATHLTRQLLLARACSRLYLVAPELLALLALETRQRVRPRPFAGAINLDVGVIATLDPVGHPTRLPLDTVVWPCGAYGCCCGGCVPDQPCPALCTVEPINGVPGAHHLIFGEPDWTPEVDDNYRRLRADGWTPTDARSAAIRLRQACRPGGSAHARERAQAWFGYRRREGQATASSCSARPEPSPGRGDASTLCR